MPRICRYAPALAFIGIATTASLTIMAFSASRATASTPFTAHPLTNASATDIGQAALQFAALNFTIAGTPQVALSRKVTNDDLTALDLPRVDFGAIEQPPVALVILRGDFSDAKLPGFPPSARYRYIGYVFDLLKGVPTRITASPDGGEFRVALNDASLPVVATPISTPTVANKTLHYGEIAPTIPRPSPPGTMKPPPVGGPKP